MFLWQSRLRLLTGLLITAILATADDVIPDYMQLNVPPPAEPPTLLNFTSASCPNYVLISARGILEPQGPSIAFPSLIASTLAALPGGTTTDVPYPATASVLDTVQGTEWVVQYVRQAHVLCPRVRFALLGYSQGALLHTMAGTQLLDPHDVPVGRAASDAIAAYLFMGNPLRAPMRAGNVDESGRQGGNFNASGETVLDYPVLFDSLVQQGKVLDVCYTGDPICDNTGRGGLAAHRKYGTDSAVQTFGYKFLIDKLGH